jgi:ATP-dependent Clp protease ATP-binding subunit ClpA
MPPPNQRQVGPFRGNAGYRQALGRARIEAIDLGHDQLGPDQILLGVLLTPDVRTDAVFEALGVSIDTLEERLRAELVRTRPRTGVAGGPDLPFTARGRNVLTRSVELAESLGFGWLGAIHLLAGIAESDSRIAPRLLREANVQSARVLELIESVARVLPPEPSDEHPIYWYVEA